MDTETNESLRTHEELWAEIIQQESNHYVPEKYQLGILTEFLDAQNVSYITEGRVFCYPIDILAYDDDSIISIELKSRNIKRGIEQALRNSDFVDHSFISLWKEDISEKIIDDISDSPIGLFAVSDSIEILSTPYETGQQLCSRESIIKTINHGRGNDMVQEF